MSRSGYSDDYDEEFPNATALYRAALYNAIRGKRGQTFLRELAEALDAMPAKRLISFALEQGGEVCAIGAVGARRGVDMSKLDPEDAKGVAHTFGIAPSMAREIVYENDEAVWREETPEQRWTRMRAWVGRHLAESA